MEGTSISGAVVDGLPRRRKGVGDGEVDVLSSALGHCLHYLVMGIPSSWILRVHEECWVVVIWSNFRLPQMHMQFGETSQLQLSLELNCLSEVILLLMLEEFMRLQLIHIKSLLSLHRVNDRSIQELMNLFCHLDRLNIQNYILAGVNLEGGGMQSLMPTKKKKFSRIVFHKLVLSRWAWWSENHRWIWIIRKFDSTFDKTGVWCFGSDSNWTNY